MRLTATAPALLLLGLLLEAIVLGGLAMHVPGAANVGSEHLADLFVAVMAVSAVVYFAAVALVLRRSASPAAVWWVLVVAIAMRLPVLFAPPFLSSDVNRYIWDGMVQAAGINPYRYVPADPALASLRDDAIYPNVSRRDYALTIYAPTAQVIFAAVARISPTVAAMKTAMLALELVAMAAILRLLDLARLPRVRLLIYAWNPLAVWAFAGNGHVDVAAIAFVALALLARGLRRDSLAGAALGAAILIKFLPAVIAPALWRRWDWRMPAACAAVIVTLYACYIGVGWRVLGFLHGYAGEEGIEQGSGIWLLAGLAKLTTLPAEAPWLYFVLIAAGLMALAATIALRGRAPTDPGEDLVRVAGNAAILAACVIVAISPHYPWYFVWLAVPACIVPYRSVVFLSVAPLLLYRNPLDERFLWSSLLYLPAILLAVLDYRRAKRGA
jgi:alpha-1,6-mannosyltransferase